MWLATLALGATTTTITPAPAWSRATVDGVAWGDAAIGDFDADGYDDVALAGLGDQGLVDLGISLFRGGPSGLSPTADLQWTVPLVDAYSPYEVVTLAAADVTGDGVADLVVGEPGETEPPSPGGIEVYPGTPGGLGAAGAPLVGERRERFGLALESAGDVNGDGVDDLLVGGVNTLLTTWSLVDGASLTRTHWQRLSWFPVAADFDADGLSNVVTADLDAYTVDVSLGSPAGLRDPTWTLPLATLGLAALDRTGDGVPDLGVFPFEYPVPAVGPIDWYPFGAAAATLSDSIPANSRVDGVGDLDGDGLDDWVVSSPKRIALFGSAHPTLQAASWDLSSTSYDHGTATTWVQRADVDGDGCGDLVFRVAADWIVSRDSETTIVDYDSVVAVVSCPLGPGAPPPTAGGSGSTPTEPSTTGTDTGSGPPVKPAATEHGGCGCASPGRGGWLGLALVALARRRRR